jgi:hypothetical protein
MPTSIAVRVSSFLLVAAALFGCRPWPASAAAAPAGMVEATLQGRKVEGAALSGPGQGLRLLGRDGRLWQLDPDEVQRLTKVSTQFRPYSLSEFRAALLRELGDAYEVSGTGHYLVAHPRGQRDRWAERFEDLYRSFVQYCSVRGLQPAAPPFPLVGVVWKSHSDFARHAAPGGNMPNGVAGYYDLNSNRINVYDMGGRADSPHWRQNASVVIHEATHQTAFNTGIHSRYAPPPAWLAEGLAMLFEAPGVHDSHNHPQRADRINRDRLRVFRQSVAPRHRPAMLTAMVASDELFHANPSAAYAEAWAFAFFLIETQPRQYLQYLKRTASRPPFQQYTEARRTADFAACFGADWRMLEARFLRFIASL